MLSLKADLHLHSVLSPCGDLVMTPAEIVKKAKNEGIEVVALTDHNSAENVEAFKYFCQKQKLNFIAGMETETREEIHILCYFPNIKALKKWQQIIYTHLPDRENDEDFFGPQIKCDFDDEYKEKVCHMLAGAADLSLEEAAAEVKKLGGVVIPSHLDRKNSIISQLGFIPPELEFRTVEISKNISLDKAMGDFPQLKSYQIIKNSDSHYLKELKAYHYLYLKELNFDEFKKAVKKVDGRKIILI